MESSSNAPTNDFAPPWLKLPTPVFKSPTPASKKPSSSDRNSADQQQLQPRRHSNSFNSYRKDLNSSTINSHSNSSEFSRLNSNGNNHITSHYLNPRHHSFGGEEQYYHNGVSQGNNNINDSRVKVGKSNGLQQRSIYSRDRDREQSREKDPTHHSNCKPTSRNFDSKTPFAPLKKSFQKKSSEEFPDNESNQQCNKNKNEENCNEFESINDEFPSLIEDKSSKDAADVDCNSYSAWTNNAAKSKVLSTSSKHKVQLIKRSASNFDNPEGSLKSEGNSFIAPKAVITSTIYRNMSLIGKVKVGNNMKENGNFCNGIGQCAKMLPVINKSTSQVTSPAMEILVKNPKMRANKSDFLKSFRNEDLKNKESRIAFDDHDHKKNGIDFDYDQSSIDNSEMEEKRRDCDPTAFDMDNTTNNSNDDYGNTSVCPHSDEINGILSSSLEAEHRFLLELGWKQDDDPSYAPLTEDEVKEFQDLINARNGFKRILNNHSVHMNLTPKKSSSLAPPFIYPSDGVKGDEESSSSSDEDDYE